jgi:hypothetical protein
LPSTPDEFQASARDFYSLSPLPHRSNTQR